VTASPHNAPSQHPGLLAKLMATVRAEFRADVLVFPADDPVFDGGVCRVGGCSRSARSQGLCPGHHQRWVHEGRPDLAVFAASTDPRWRPQRPNQRCRVPGCGTARLGAGCVNCTLSGGNALAAPI
jgi:hypothetical protein